MTVLSNRQPPAPPVITTTSLPPYNNENATSTPPPPDPTEYFTTNNDDVEASKLKKKRGLWSKFLIKIHLKKKHKKGGDTERIIEEDEVFTPPPQPQEESSFKRKAWKSKSLMRSFKYHKRSSKKQESFKDKTKLIMTSHESIPQLNEEPTNKPSRKGSFLSRGGSGHTPDKYSYQGKRVDLALIPDKYELLEETTADDDVIIINDESAKLSSVNDDDSGIQDDSYDSFHDSFCDSEEDLFRDSQGSTVRGKLQKSWNGERAKNARRSIRRGSSQAWKGLKHNLQSPLTIPEPNGIVSRLRRTQSARRYKSH